MRMREVVVSFPLCSWRFGAPFLFRRDHPALCREASRPRVSMFKCSPRGPLLVHQGPGILRRRMPHFAKRTHYVISIFNAPNRPNIVSLAAKLRPY